MDYSGEKIEVVAILCVSYVTMAQEITVRRVDDVPAGSRVCHYDELEEAAKATLPALANTTEASVDRAVADGLRDCDLVKYTEYYEVSVH